MPRIIQAYDPFNDTAPIVKKELPHIINDRQEHVPEKIDIVPATNRNYSNNNTCNFVSDFGELVNSSIRTKPTYSDCWLIGNSMDLDVIDRYDLPGGKAVVGYADDGEIEYNLFPSEYGYPDSLNAVIVSCIEFVRSEYRKKGGKLDRAAVFGMAKGFLLGCSDTIEAVFGSDSGMVESAIGEMCAIVHRYTIGLGIFEILLNDPRLEDVYIDAPCDKNRIHVTMNGIEGINSHIRCRTNLIVDKREVMNLINVLKRESGLPFCESSPVLETNMSAYDARATVIGYPMSPNGNAVAVRKHSTKPWTLTRLVANGTMDAHTAGLLSFLVDNRVTFLVCGARGAGKSSLLSALMFEFPLSQRILTIEDTIELPGDMMRKMGYKVQSMLIDDKIDGNQFTRADEALRVSLRMGESAIVLGEVRGEEARTLYQSMRTGRAGSSIMGTIHGDSAKTVYERVVHDMGISPEAFMATEVLITLGTVKDKKTGNQVRMVNELVATGTRPGRFIELKDDRSLLKAPMMERIRMTSQMSDEDILREIEARSLIREFLAEYGKEHGDSFFGPEWISVSNDVISKNTNGTPEDILDAFKVRMRTMVGEQ